MPKYPLTERQRNLIRSLIPCLHAENIELSWYVFTRNGEIARIRGLEACGEWREVFKNVRLTDFDDFVRCGLFHQKSQTHYTLNEFLILDAVERDFADDEQVQPTQITISGGDFRGSNVNIASRLNHVQQSIGSASSLTDDAKAQLTQLISELKEALSKVPEEEAEEAEVLARHVQAVTDELNVAEPNKKWLQTNVNGLEQAAKNLERVAIPITAIAVKIAVILRPLTM